MNRWAIFARPSGAGVARIQYRCLRCAMRAITAASRVRELYWPTKRITLSCTLHVPEGRMIIAQRFIAGTRGVFQNNSPVGTTECDSGFHVGCCVLPSSPHARKPEHQAERRQEEC